MRDDKEKLEKILESTDRIREYIKSGKDFFLRDHLRVVARAAPHGAGRIVDVPLSRF